MGSDEAKITYVEDVEVVFRSVPDEPTMFKVETGGRPRFSSSAFNDRDRRPSVDRASLTDGQPASSCQSPQSGVVSIIVARARAIQTVKTLDSKQCLVFTHDVDVVHVPLSENYAHAEIQTSPALVNDSVFKRLKEALCRLADVQGWEYPPASQRVM